MKHILKIIVVYLLGLCARGVVRRYKPHIVMITGSVGKTSTKDAVASVLKSRFYVRKSDKSFNSEFGVPFTIFGVNNPWRNPVAWLTVLKSAIALLILPNHYPNMLVLEAAADRPGDLARILRIATPETVVVTRLPDIPVHVEAYSSPEAVREEEFSPAYELGKGKTLVIPADDPYSRALSARTSAHVITYGVAEDAQVRMWKDSFYETEKTIKGMSAMVRGNGEEGMVVVEGSVGRTQMLSVAAAIAVASSYGIPLHEALQSLKSYEPPPGRGRILAGKAGATIIDDSYNASPVAVEEALKTLHSFPHAKRRIAVLGDMLELGRYSVAEHERIGALARELADVVVAVGIRARSFASSVGGAEVMTFDTAHAAADALGAFLRTGDVVLVKGSESIRTERIVKAMLEHTADFSKLVRQEPAWLRKS